MIQPKTSLGLLKYLGVTLVTLPEPVTTVFGVGLLFTANYLSRKIEVGKDNFLPETAGYYSYWFKHPRDYVDAESGAPVAAKSYTQGQKPPTPWPQEVGRRLETSRVERLPEASAYYSYWFKQPRDDADAASIIPETAKSYSRSQQPSTPHPRVFPAASLRGEPRPRWHGQR